jgi:hypothetical protein
MLSPEFVEFSIQQSNIQPLLPTKGRREPAEGGAPPSPGIHGAVAQLGERLICIQEVVGSIPISSTNPGIPPAGGPLLPGRRSEKVLAQMRDAARKRAASQIFAIIDR